MHHYLPDAPALEAKLGHEVIVLPDLDDGAIVQREHPETGERTTILGAGIALRLDVAAMLEPILERNLGEWL